jgi:hypothetical protein
LRATILAMRQKRLFHARPVHEASLGALQRDLLRGISAANWANALGEQSVQLKLQVNGFLRETQPAA